MRVSEIWRHPVKSLRGESLASAAIDREGLRGDRAWGIRDESTGKILTGRREPRLLMSSAILTESGEPQLTLPDGATCVGPGDQTDTALSAWLGAPVSLVRASDHPASKAEFFTDATDDSSAPVEWTMPADRFVDAMPILIVTTASLRAGLAAHPAGNWNVRRFRPNLVVEVEGTGWIEDGWCGSQVRIGDVVFVPRQACVRCTMVTRAQPDLPRDLDVYKSLARLHGGTFGVWNSVEEPGIVTVGDLVEVV
jgi:uncharacterized protein